ncbi:hypothetical protein [Streptomyces sp. NPDC025273]|uniref:hypothetical protein n=1 Tax=unclassified Streptomyces TaxID=2593676 RepID=UPI00340A51C0
MSGADAQEALLRLLTEPAAMAALREDPATFALRYGLSVAAAQRLSSTGMPGLRVSASVARWKSFSGVMGTLPATLALCRDVVDDDTIFGEVLVHVRMTRPQEIVRAATLLGRLASRDAPDADRHVIEDVVRYECLPYELPAPIAEQRPLPGGGPSLGSGVRVVSFDCVVTELQRRVLAGEAFDDLRGRRTHCLVTVGSGARMRVHRIPAALRKLLDLCDGSRTVPALAGSMGVSATQVEQALAKVRALGVEVLSGTSRRDGSDTPAGDEAATAGPPADDSPA